MKLTEYALSVEGILALHDPALRSLYDLKVCHIVVTAHKSPEKGYVRYLYNATRTLCLHDVSGETSRNVVEA